MPDYRHAYAPGGAVFLTLVTFNRKPIFAESENVQRLREKIAIVTKGKSRFDTTSQPLLNSDTMDIGKPWGMVNVTKRFDY